VGYLALYVNVPDTAAILGLCLLMGLVTSAGIRDSATLIAGITLLELSGLLLVITLAGSGEPRELPPSVPVGAVLLGAFLAFYAFIGFEDMVNLAEEVREPERVLPRAILLAILGASLLYLLVTGAAVRFVDLGELARSDSPLALMIGDHPRAQQLLGAIGLVAISNGALTQIIMGSRVLYGMGRRGLMPALFSRVNPVTRTPLVSTWTLVVLVAAFAVFLPLAALAKITSAIMLVIFVLVNLTLIRVHRRAGPAPAFRTWRWVPWLSLSVNVALLAYQCYAIISGSSG
jgi:amino acid transporter